MTTRVASRSAARRRAAAVTATAGAVALLASCSFFSTLNETTTGTTGKPKASTTTVAAAPTTVTGGPRPPKTLPGGFPAPLTLEGVKVKLTEMGKFDEPTAFTTRPGYPNYYVAERKGRVRQITVDLQYDKDGKLLRKGIWFERGYVLDLSREISHDGERGMYGIAFSSDGRTMFVSWTAKDGKFRVSSWQVYDYSVDGSTRKDILTIDHPSNVNVGGTLAMGPDGFLYVGVGDGGGGDPQGHAQDPKSLLGKILRIDPGGGIGDFPYGIPDNNPFKDGSAGAPEVWSLGLAKPRTFSFDRITHDLWVPDSSGTNEEVSWVPVDGYGFTAKGANFGWNRVDGTKPVNGASAPAGAVAPVLERAHTDGTCGIVGGHLYRGLNVLPMAGAYIYGDYCTGEIRGLITDGPTVLDDRGLGVSVPGQNLAGFGEDEAGELWVLLYDGRIMKLEAA